MKLLLTLLLTSSLVFAAGKLQDADFKSEAELVGAGATAASLLNDTKIYVTSVAKTLDDAIADGDIGAASPTTTQGDLIVRGLLEDERLPIGVQGANLVSNGTTLEYSTTLTGTLNPVTDWETFTVSGSWSSNVTYTGKYRRVGDSAEIAVYISVSGAPNSSNLNVNMPAGLVIDTSKLTDTSSNSTIIGEASVFDGSTDQIAIIRYETSTTVSVWGQRVGSAEAHRLRRVSQSEPFTFGNRDSVKIKFKVPIVGWSSGVDGVVQNKVLTAATDNYCTGFIPANGSAVFRENYNGCIGVTKISAGTYRLNYSAMSLSNTPSIMANSMDIGSGVICGQDNAFSNTTTETQVICRNTSNALTDTNFMYKITKVENDYNKAKIIVGTFGKCQTKFLSTDISSSTTSIIDLRLQNLNTSKLYSITLNASFVYSVGNTCTMYANDGVQDLLILQNREADSTADRTIDTSTNPFFSPGSSTINIGMSENATCVLEGNNTFSETWVTICEVNKSQTTQF